MKKAYLFLAVLITFAFGANAFAACTTAFPTSAKKEFLDGVHLAANTYKIAFYTDTATYGAATTAYSATNEVSGTGYTAGGYTLDTRASNTSGTTAWLDFADEVASTVTFTSAAKCVIIYNDTVAGDPAIYVGNLASAVQPSAGTLTVTFPAADATNAIVRVQ
jgi:hypothetical protein